MRHRFMLFARLAVPFLLGLAPSLVRAQTFTGWVSYQKPPRVGDLAAYQTTDTLFIAGDSAVRKTITVEIFFDIPLASHKTHFLVYGQRVRRVSLFHIVRPNNPHRKPLVNETVYPDSIEQGRRAKRTVEVVPLDSTKVILGYPCKLALVKTRHTYFDEPRELASLVFYTTEMPNVTDEYDGLGGLPLESWSFGGSDINNLAKATHSVATSVVASSSLPWAYFEPRRLYPRLEVKSTVWDGKIRKLPELPKSNRPYQIYHNRPSRLRERVLPGKYAWEAN